MPEFFRRLFDASDFPARWHCGPWTPAMGWASQAGDLATALAYFAITAALFWFWRRRRDDIGASGGRMLLWFVAFITACGLTHVCNVLAFHWPAYRLFTAVKVVAGLVSARAALMLPWVVAEAVRLPTRSERHVLRGQLWEAQLLKAEAYDGLAEASAKQAETIAALQEHIRHLEARKDGGGPPTGTDVDMEIAELRRIIEGIRP